MSAAKSPPRIWRGQIVNRNSNLSSTAEGHRRLKPTVAFDDQFSRQQLAIEQLREGLEATREGLERMESRLLRLSASQEALELQTALLSSEAEHGLPRTAPPAAIFNDATASVTAIEQLQSQLNELSQALQTHITQSEARSDMVEARVQELHQANHRRETEVSDLSKVVSSLNQAAADRSGPGALKDADWTKKALRILGDEVGALKTASSIAEGQMMQLEKRREALSAKLKVLNLQQVRTDQDFRRFQKRLKQLALPTAIVSLTIVTFLMWLATQA